MTDNDDDAIVVDLTHPYDADWMARGRKESEYTDAFRDRLQQEYGLDREEAEDIGMQSFSDRFRIHEREWDVIWAMDEEPGEAVETYLGEARVEVAAREQAGEEVPEDLYEQAQQQRDRLEASREIERYLQQEDADPIAVSGFGPWNPTSPLELEDGEWDALIEAGDAVAYLGEETVEETFEQYVEAGGLPDGRYQDYKVNHE
jgi:hypothetical protein